MNDPQDNKAFVGFGLLGIPWRKVLCWVCSENEPDAVVLVARSMAKLVEGQCHVVMSLDAPLRARSTRGGSTPLTPEIISRAKQKLAELYGEGVSTMVLPGHPITEIKRYARNNHVDLIVMGERGLAVEREYGQRLCDDAPCAVLIIVTPRDEKGRSTPMSQEAKRHNKHER